MFATEVAAPPSRPAPGRAGLDLLAERVRPTSASRTRLLPVPAPLAPLLPDGGLRRGSVVHCTGAGELSLALALIGRASSAGCWCALVGVADPGVLAAVGYGADLRRLVVVRVPPAQVAPAAAALLEGLDVVLLQPPGRSRPAGVRQLVARARRSGSVLLVLGGPAGWPGPADVRLRVAGSRWCGLERGAGRLQARRVSVVAHGHGATGRPVERELWLPAAAGHVAAA